MNSKQRKVLEKIRAVPVSRNITWREVESLIKGLGGKITQRKGGSGRALSLPGKARPLPLHVPHPDPYLKIYAVKLLCDFLEGVECDENE